MTPATRALLPALILAALIFSSASAAIYTGTPTKTYDPVTKTITLKAAGNTLATVRVVDTVSSLTFYEEVLEITPALDFEFQASRITSRAVTQIGKYGAVPASITYLRKSTGSREVPDYECTGGPDPEDTECTLKGYHTVYYPIEEWIPISNTISVKSNEPYKIKFRYQKKAETGYSRTYIEPSLFNVPLSEFSWWDTNYGFKTKFNVTGGSITTSPYQLRLRVYNTSGTSTTNTFYSTNFSVLNMSDFRVTDSTETIEWYYWVNSTFNDGMDIWIRAPSIAQRPTNTTFYIYNGFAGASSTSDGYTTFLPLTFDHFPGTAINATNWNTGGGGIKSVSNSILNVIGNGAWGTYVNCTGLVGVNTSTHALIQIEDEANNYGYIGHISPVGTDAIVDLIGIGTGWAPGIITIVRKSNSNLHYVGQGNEPSGFNDYINIRNSSERILFNYPPYIASYALADSFNLELSWEMFPYGNGYTMQMDRIFARNYIYPEPQIEYGYLEAEKPAAPVSAFTCAPLTGCVLPPVDITCTDSSSNTPTAWSWVVTNETDGVSKTSTAQNPVFKLGISGSYSVNLSASNDGGSDWENKSSYVGISDCPAGAGNCTGSFVANVTEGYPPLVVLFTYSGNTTILDNITWTFGEGNTSEEWNPTAVYNGTAAYDVHVSVYNITYKEWCNLTYWDYIVTSWFFTCEWVDEDGNVPITLVYLLIPLAMGLSVFAVWSYDNRVYANIALGGFGSSVLWFFLAANIITGNVFFLTGSRDCVFMDTPTFWLFVMMGIIMTVYSLALTFEAIMERRMDIGGEEE